MQTKLSTQRIWFSRVLKTAMYASLLLTVALIIFLIVYITVMGVQTLNLDFIFSSPSYLTETVGIWPNILNTLYMILMTLIIVLPLGIGAAVYLNEYATNQRMVSFIMLACEILSGIPSIIYGLVGMLLFSNNFGTSILAGSLTLVMMNIPTVIRTTQESLRTVPSYYRESAIGLGAGKWRVISTVVLPSSIAGVLTGSILTIGRIVGETAALLFTAGFAHVVNNFIKGIVSPGSTLSVALYVYAKEQGEFEIAFSIAFILLLLTFILNCLAEYLKYHFMRGKNND